MDKLSYALGLGIGQQLLQMGTKNDINVDDFALAIKDVLDGETLKMKNSEAQQTVQDYFCKPSVQPAITCCNPKVAGSPRCTLLSKMVPSVRKPS